MELRSAEGAPARRRTSANRRRPAERALSSVPVRGPPHPRPSPRVRVGQPLHGPASCPRRDCAVSPLLRPLPLSPDGTAPARGPRCSVRRTRQHGRPSMDSKLGHFDLRGWTRLVDASDRPWWSGPLAVSAVLGLLLAFHQVVRASAQRAELQHQASAVLAEATWRCKALRGAEIARNCLAGLTAQPDLDRAVPARPAVLPRLVALSDGAGTRQSPQSRSRNIRPATPRGLAESTE